MSKAYNAILAHSMHAMTALSHHAKHASHAISAAPNQDVSVPTSAWYSDLSVLVHSLCQAGGGRVRRGG